MTRRHWFRRHHLSPCDSSDLIGLSETQQTALNTTFIQSFPRFVYKRVDERQCVCLCVSINPAVQPHTVKVTGVLLSL